MKKVLLATTALTFSAGYALAQENGITITGSAEMGIADDDSASSVQFVQDIDLTFSFIGTTDNGLSFGAAIDIDEVDNQGGSATQNDLDDGGVAVFISGEFGTFTLGDTDGAFDFALAEVDGGGALQDDHTIHEGFNGNGGLDGSSDGQILRWDRNFGDFAVAVSYEQDATTAGAETDSPVGETIGVGVRGSFGDFTVGVGYQDNDIDDIVGISVGYDFGDFNIVGNYADQDTLGSRYAIGVTYASGPITLSANYGDQDNDVTGIDVQGFGLAANYDLGGGAEVQFGYGSSDEADIDTYSLGISMSF
ncbi:porin [Rhodobacteraceae bacterium]|nr:porin [Paracoccaceae bacterium]